MPVETIHTSDHARIADLRRLAEAVAPGRLVPIHSLEPKRFSEFFGDVVERQDGNWWEVRSVGDFKRGVDPYKWSAIEKLAAKGGNWRTYLLSLWVPSGQVEVLDPDDVRRDFAASARGIASHYRRPPCQDFGESVASEREKGDVAP